MRVFIIDTRTIGPELKSGLIGVVGSINPTSGEKSECVDTMSRYTVDGWGIAADPSTSIGQLAALTAEAACVPFMRLDDGRLAWLLARTIGTTRGPLRDSADLDGSPFPALTPETRIREAGSAGPRIENGGR